MSTLPTSDTVLTVELRQLIADEATSLRLAGHLLINLIAYTL